jgi:hypothetical protein
VSACVPSIPLEKRIVIVAVEFGIEPELHQGHGVGYDVCCNVFIQVVYIAWRGRC